MPFDPIHISDDLLERYLLKNVTEAETEACEEHILGCASCAIVAEEALRLFWALEAHEHLHASGGLQVVQGGIWGVQVPAFTVQMTTACVPCSVGFNWRLCAASGTLAATFALGVWLGTSFRVAPVLLTPYVAAARIVPPDLPIVQPAPQPGPTPVKRTRVASIPKQHHLPPSRRRAMPPALVPVPESAQIVIDLPSVALNIQMESLLIPMESPEVPAYQRRRSWVVRLFTAVRKSFS
jgi:hypothetical protein